MTSDTEKVTINLGYVDLGRIELLVREGFYTNRSDFIRTAIRARLDAHDETVKGSATRQSLEFGVRSFNAANLEAVRRAGETLHLRIVGLARFEDDVSPELALATVASLQVVGALQAPAEVRAALASRMS